MRLTRVQFQTNNHEVFQVLNEEDWMISVCKPGCNGPGLIVPRKERPNIENCGHELTEEETRRMLTPFAERVAERAGEIVTLGHCELEYLIDELLNVLPNLL